MPNHANPQLGFDGTRDTSKLRDRCTFRAGHDYAQIYGDEMRWLCDCADQFTTLREAAQHAILEMRDRFDLKRGDSVSLDALEELV